jgi:hypothetical protein
VVITTCLDWRNQVRFFNPYSVWIFVNACEFLCVRPLSVSVFFPTDAFVVIFVVDIVDVDIVVVVFVIFAESLKITNPALNIPLLLSVSYYTRTFIIVNFYLYACGII